MGHATESDPTEPAASGDVVGDRVHLVEFYETEAFLVDTVVGFVVRALRRGDAAIVVATADHRGAFAASIQADGIDLEACEQEGRYVAVDADELLSTFMVDGAPDPVRFRHAVGSALDRAAAGTREVSVYGEMVALLWARGDVASTIALEDLWNQLSAARPFSLLCAYPMSAFDDGTSAEFGRICSQHTDVIPTALPDRTSWVSGEAPSPRSGSGSSDAGARFGVPLMAKALGGLYLAGGTLALLTLLLPHSGRTRELGLLVIVAAAYLVSVALLGMARRVPRWLLPVALGWGTTLITVAAYLSAERPSPLIFFYLWVFLYSSYFLTRAQAAAQVAYAGVAYGVLLGAQPPAEALAWWVVAMGTLLVTAALIWTMRERVDSLIARLCDTARTDPLTKLLNRRGFRELLDLEIERSRRTQLGMTLLAGDVDHFKAVNDCSGHQVGDSVLQRIAGVLESAKRQVDTVSRVGGEEFALILPDTDQGGALIVAERLRCALLDEFAGDPVPITISFGIATLHEHGETAASLMRAADDALYEAKESGRNRSVLFRRENLGRANHPKRDCDVEGERFTGIMLDLAGAVDLRFSGSARHSETVGRYAEMIASELGLSEQRVGRIRLGGLLHDVGKVGIPDAILNKPGPLTAQEQAVIRTHPALGAQILESACLADIRGWVGAHHERPDGQGYPHGLSGSRLALEARILAVADAYEAMTSDRAYRSSLGAAAARAELTRCAGPQFDADVVAALLAVLDRESQRAWVGAR